MIESAGKECTLRSEEGLCRLFNPGCFFLKLQDRAFLSWTVPGSLLASFSGVILTGLLLQQDPAFKCGCSCILWSTGMLDSLNWIPELSQSNLFEGGHGSCSQETYACTCSRTIWMRGESRWQCRRTWSSPFPTNTSKKKSTGRMIHTEHHLNTGRRPQTSKRDKNPSTLCVEQRANKKREKRKKGIRIGPAHLRGSCERRKESTPGKAT